MNHTLSEDAHAIILPAFADTSLSQACKSFLDNGGVSILLGESREEYVGRGMTEDRRGRESPETFHRVVAEAKSHVPNLLVAVDQEMGGICRLHDLVPAYPPAVEVPNLSSEEIEDISHRIGIAGVGLGINCFLAPILDLLTGENPWLAGRTYSVDPGTVGRVSAAFVRGVQRAGVAATAKHFPGFHNISGDPAIDAEARVSEPTASFEPGFGPFRDVIAAEIEMIMVGPAIVDAFDLDKAALRSGTVVGMLKEQFGFRGIVMADDLDSKATMRGDSLEEVAVDAVKAGCDLLLMADIDDHLSDVAGALVAAADDGRVSRDQLSKSADKIRRLVSRYGA